MLFYAELAANEGEFTIAEATREEHGTDVTMTLRADADEFLQSGEAYRRLLLEQRVDGLLIASASTDETLLGELARSGLPFVLDNPELTSIREQ